MNAVRANLVAVYFKQHFRRCTSIVKRPECLNGIVERKDLANGWSDRPRRHERHKPSVNISCE
jgi:hypothetical protein